MNKLTKRIRFIFKNICLLIQREQSGFRVWLDKMNRYFRLGDGHRVMFVISHFGWSELTAVLENYYGIVDNP